MLKRRERKKSKTRISIIFRPIWKRVSICRRTHVWFSFRDQLQKKKERRKKREAEDEPDTTTNCWAGDVAGDGLPFRFSEFRSEYLRHFQSKPKLDDWMGIESRSQLRTIANASVTQTRRERVLPAPRTGESVLLADPRSGPFDSPYIMNGSLYVRITRKRKRERERKRRSSIENGYECAIFNWK